MMLFKGRDGTATFAKGVLVADPFFKSCVEALVVRKLPVTFEYWAPVTASLDDDWSAYLTIGSCWTEVYNDVPQVIGVPEPPGGYEEEGPEVSVDTEPTTQ